VYVGDPLAERRNGIASAHIAPARRRWLRPEAARIVGDPIVLSGREFVKCIATTLTVCGCLRRAQPRPVRADHRRRRQRSGRRCHQPDRRPQIRRPHTGTGRARLPHIGDEHGNSPKASRPTMVNGQRPTAITTNGSTAATSVHPHRKGEQLAISVVQMNPVLTPVVAGARRTRTPDRTSNRRRGPTASASDSYEPSEPSSPTEC
jgi:hypothetical protein